jgi:hypothetical protein
MEANLGRKALPLIRGPLRHGVLQLRTGPPATERVAGAGTHWFGTSP